jgi:hypothetical protein
VTSGSSHVGSFSQSKSARGLVSGSGLVRCHCRALSRVHRTKLRVLSVISLYACRLFLCQHLQSPENPPNKKAKSLSGKIPGPLTCVLPTPNRARKFHKRLVIQVIVRHASGEEFLE